MSMPPRLRDGRRLKADVEGSSSGFRKSRKCTLKSSLTHRGVPSGCPGEAPARLRIEADPIADVSDHFHEGRHVRPEEFQDVVSGVRDDDLPHFCLHVRENPDTLHPLGLELVIFRRSEVMHGIGFVAMDQKQLDERHHSLLAQALLAGRERGETSAMTIERGRR